MQKKLSASGLIYLWVSVIILIVDRVTKCLVLQNLLVYYATPVVPGFNLTLSFNKGAAFSFLNSQNGWQVWFFGAIALLVSLGILFWLARLSSRKDRWTAIALSLIVGGALGNFWDRISYGHVVDFIQLYISDYYWPTFNIADSAICIGAVILFFGATFSKKKL